MNARFSNVLYFLKNASKRVINSPYTIVNKKLKKERRNLAEKPMKELVLRWPRMCESFGGFVVEMLQNNRKFYNEDLGVWLHPYFDISSWMLVSDAPDFPHRLI